MTGTAREEAVLVLAHGVPLAGSLAVPEGAAGVVAFAHGSAGNRLGARNRQVAAALRGAGLATLLFDLMTAKEEELDRSTAHLRFNIDLLSHRLVGAVHWLLVHPRTRGLPVGVLGAGTGAAAAITAAAREPDRVSAVVSRGGRPDLAGIDLARVRAPTLLIAGGADSEVLAGNRDALRALTAASECRLEIVAGAGHLFEEPGALERVAELASSWLARHLAAADRPPLHDSGDPL
ncbi:MAG TPA: dienelactone hydrolase family protein [Kofleriaceae bacterium]|nr:dienelactone hydrolase family protein [Kofleriaceae bacterium]